MEVDKNLTELFSALYTSLDKENVQAMDFLLWVNLRLDWPRIEPLTTKAVLMKMMELGIWNVDLKMKECNLSSLIYLLYKIGRRDLSAVVKNYG